MSDSPFEAPTRVDFHFDVICPWAYQTSLWMREVAERRGLEVDWRFFSLEEVNRVEGKKHPWEREWSYGWSMMRIGALLKRRDPALNDAWYLRSGTALHVEGRQPHRAEVARDLLSEMDLDPGLVDEALADPTTHDDVRADHERVTSMGGWGFRRSSSPVPTRMTPASSSARSSSTRRPARPPNGSGTWSSAGWSSRTCSSCSVPRPLPTWPRSARCSGRTWRPVSGTSWPTPPTAP